MEIGMQPPNTPCWYYPGKYFHRNPESCGVMDNVLWTAPTTRGGQSVYHVHCVREPDKSAASCRCHFLYFVMLVGEVCRSQYKWCRWDSGDVIDVHGDDRHQGS